MTKAHTPPSLPLSLPQGVYLDASPWVQQLEQGGAGSAAAAGQRTFACLEG